MRLRQVKSECHSHFVKKIKKERTKTPLRYSRRLRRLPPEKIIFFENIRDELKRAKNFNKSVISQPSSCSFNPGKKRKLRFPQKARNSKEVISILSAPKICVRKSSIRKLSEEIPAQVKVRGSAVQPNLVFKGHVCPFSPNPVFVTKIKKERPWDAEDVLHHRKKFVLEMLNKGDIKDIQKLPTIGNKTAEMILLYRKLKGGISTISDLSRMPKFPKKRYNNFVAQNYLSRRHI